MFTCPERHACRPARLSACLSLSWSSYCSYLSCINPPSTQHTQSTMASRRENRKSRHMETATADTPRRPANMCVIDLNKTLSAATFSHNFIPSCTDTHSTQRPQQFCTASLTSLPTMLPMRAHTAHKPRKYSSLEVSQLAFARSNSVSSLSIWSGCTTRISRESHAVANFCTSDVVSAGAPFPS